MELGGFAENEYSIDGNEENFVSYNFCLAELYLLAMASEDWDALGYIDESLVHNVCKWINYNGKYKSEYLLNNEVTDIYNGLILTNKNRSFLEAIIAAKKGDIAETFIYLGNHDVRLYVTATLYGELVSENILNYIHEDFKQNNFEDYITFLNKLFSTLDTIYINTPNVLKIKFLKQIRPFLLQIRYDKVHRESMVLEKNKFKKCQWYIDMKNI